MPRAAHDDAAGREIGAGADFHQLIDRNARLVDHAHDAVANFAQVVRRNAGGHAHGDAAGAVDQQVRQLRGQHRRLAVALVIGGNEIDRVELQIVQQQCRVGRHARFGVPHGGRRQAGDRAEVTLLIDQHVAHVPFLGHAHQRRIDHAFAVRMIVTAGIAGDLRALHAAGARREIQIVHRHQNAALRRL